MNTPAPAQKKFVPWEAFEGHPMFQNADDKVRNKIRAGWERDFGAQQQSPVLNPLMAGATPEVAQQNANVSRLMDTIQPGWREQDVAGQPTPVQRTFGGTAKDVGIDLLKGAISVPEAAVGIADIPTLGYAGKLAEKAGFRPGEAKALLEEGYSPARQEAGRKFEEADGFMDKLATAGMNPSVVGSAVLESLPLMGAGGAAARYLPAALSATARGAMGEGIVSAGSSAEGMRQETESGTLTPAQSALATAAGMATSLFGAIGGKVAQRLGIDDIETLAAGGAGVALKKNIARRAIEGAFSEGILEELPQSVAEQMLQNVAMGRPATEGVEDAAVLGMLSGAAMGGGVNLMSGSGDQGPSEGRQAAEAVSKIRRTNLPVDDLMAMKSDPESLAEHGLVPTDIDSLLAERADDLNTAETAMRDAARGPLTRVAADAMRMQQSQIIMERAGMRGEQPSPLMAGAGVQPEAKKSAGDNMIEEGLNQILGEPKQDDVPALMGEEGSSPSTAADIGEHGDDMIQGALNDIYQRDQNLAGLQERAKGRPSTAEESAQVFAESPESDLEQRLARREDAQAAFENYQPNLLPARLRPGVALMEEQMDQGEVGSRWQNEDGSWGGVKTTNPEWMQKAYLDKNVEPELARRLNKGNIRRVLRLVREKGEGGLSARELDVWIYLKGISENLQKNDPKLVAAANADKIQAEGIELGKKETVAAGDLAPGDKVVVETRDGIPDLLEHKGFDSDGNALLQDGQQLTVDPFEQLNVIGKKLTPDRGEKVSRMATDALGWIRKSADIDDLQKKRGIIAKSQRPEVAPYRDMITGAIDRRIKELGGTTEETTPLRAGEISPTAAIDKKPDKTSDKQGGSFVNETVEAAPDKGVDTASHGQKGNKNKFADLPGSEAASVAPESDIRARAKEQYKGWKQTPEQAIKIAADDVMKLRGMDVRRVLGDAKNMEEVAAYIKEKRPELSRAVNEAIGDIEDQRKRFGRPGEAPEVMAEATGQKEALAEEKEARPVEKIDDFGEKIGGARKDLVESSAGKGVSKKETVAEPPWRKRFKALQKIDGSGKWIIADTKNRYGRSSGQAFATQEEAEEAIPLYAAAAMFTPQQEKNGKWELYKRVGDRKRLKMTDKGFGSREDAMEYLARNAVPLLETKTSFGEEILPVPDIATRTGVERRTSDATPEMFMETFAPRGIEFGNWNNQEERQLVMNHAYDGLLDLADTLNIPPKALMLDGELALAFGARGQGLSGAKAHYEPGYSVINLTKMKGAGSLAHEWLHALDHYLARLDTKASSAKEKNERGDFVFKDQGNTYLFQSHGPSYKSAMREELREAYTVLVKGLFTKAEQYVEDTERADKFLATGRRHLRDTLDAVRRDLAADYSQWRKRNGKPASAEQLAEFDRLADILVEGGDLEVKWIDDPTSKSKFVRGRYSNSTVEAMHDIYKSVRGRKGFNPDGKGVFNNILGAMKGYKARLQMFEEAKDGIEKTKKVPTNYAIEARKMDQARTGDYWSNPHEMLARAFAAYVEDAIAGKGGQSDFLVYHAHGGILLPMIDGFVARPYPEGKEREAINKLFDDFVGKLKTKETDKGVALYSRTSVKPWPADFPKAFAHTTVGKVTGHPDHAAAKAGDLDAARRLVDDLLKPERVAEITKRFPNAIIVPVIEQEKSGINAIPYAIAEAYQDAGLQMDENFHQVGRAKRSGLDAAQRLLARKEFSGEVVKGGKYILVDDILTQGGTIHEMYHHIVNNGGEVAGVVSLAFSAGSNIIAIQAPTINKLAMRFGRGKLERILDEFNIAGTIEALTESEGNAILRFKSLDSLRNRLDEANRSLLAQKDLGAQPLRSVREALTFDAPTGATSSEVKSELTSGQNGKGVQRLLDKGTLRIVQSAAELPEGASLNMVAWHGSPHEFDKFSTNQIDIPAMKAKIDRLRPKVYAAYSAGNQSRAELLDAELEELYESLEAALDDADMEPDQDFGDAYGPESDLAAAYGEMYRGDLGGRSYLAGEPEADKRRVLFEIAEGYGPRHGGFLGTEQQVFDAARDAYEARVKRQRRASQSKDQIGGAYDLKTDTMYLVADGIEQGQAERVLRHEAFHRAKEMGEFAPILQELANMEKRIKIGKVPVWFAEARAAAQVDKDSPHYIEEIGAYAVQQYDTAPGGIKKWVEKFLAKVKAVMFRTLGLRLGRLDPAMLNELAASGLRATAEKDSVVGEEGVLLSRSTGNAGSLIDDILSKDRARNAPAQKTQSTQSKTQKTTQVDFNQDMKQAAGFVAEKMRSKRDATALDIILSTPEYFFEKDGAAKRVLEAQMSRRDLKFENQHLILGDFLEETERLKKEDKASYEKTGRYLRKVDKTGKGFRIKRNTGWEVTRPDGTHVDYAPTREEGIMIARKVANKKEGELIGDYGVAKAEWWDVIDPEGEITYTMTNEEEAVQAMIDAESAWLQKHNYGEPVVAAVKRFRQMTGRAFDMMAADMRRIIEEAREQGLDEPTVTVVDEERRWGIFAPNGKKLAEFDSQERAEMMINEVTKTYPRYGQVTIRRQADSEIRKEVTLTEAIALMGDMRGVYFPRIRNSGRVVLRVEHPRTGKKILKKFDLYVTDNRALNVKTGEIIGKDLGVLRKTFNALTPLGREIRKLQKEGYDGTIQIDESVPESVFDVAQLVASMDAMLNEAARDARKKDDPESKRIAQEINKILVSNVADLFKQRGYLSSRMKRADDYWEGFEEDMLMAGTQYAGNMAAGFAKRDAARQMVLAATGRDIPFQEWKIENGNDYEKYLEFVEERRVDPGKQKVMYSQVMKFIREVLRNEEAADRIMGTMKGLAVLKFLGFRVSSAAVNMTNMVQAVPATISSHSGASITASLNAVKRAAVQYTKYRTGKGELSTDDRAIFLEITHRGWDEAMFNQDAARLLQSRAGNFYDEKIMKPAMWLFGATEKANRSMTIFAAYTMLKKQNPDMSEEALLQKAKHASDRAHGVYGKETAPAWTRGSINPLKLFYVFQKFMHNYLLNAAEMGFKGDYKQAAWMLLSPTIIAGQGASLVTAAIFKALELLPGGGDDPEEEFYTWAEETFGSDRLFRYGLAGVAGVNIKGSLEMRMPMPTTLPELGGAPVAVLTDLWDAGRHAVKGEGWKALEKVLPMGFGNPIKAVREKAEGVTSGGYSPIYYGDQPVKGDSVDAILRFFSFNPASLSTIREKQWHENQVAGKYKARQDEIYDRFRRMLVQNNFQIDPEVMPEIEKEVQRYNELVVGSGRQDIPLIKTKSMQGVWRRALIPNTKERMREAEGVEPKFYPYIQGLQEALTKE